VKLDRGRLFSRGALDFTGSEELPECRSNGYFFLKQEMERFESVNAQIWHGANAGAHLSAGGSSGSVKL
jgi:hypothetical protein